MMNSINNGDNNLDNKNEQKKSKMSGMKTVGSAALIAAMVLGGPQKLEGKWLQGTNSQKQSIEILKSQGKLLPNVSTDFNQYGKHYLSGLGFIYNVYPYSDKWQRYEADNIADVDGKNLTIQNDIDSCNFLNETVYKNNLDRIVPIIIDNQIDTLGAAPGEYDRVDWQNSWSFIGGIPNKETLTTKTGTGLTFGSHMNAMANVLIAKKDNMTEEYYSDIDKRLGREAVGVRPGKVRLYVTSPASGGNVETPKALNNIYDEAKNNPDKKFILSFSRTGASDDTNDGFNKIASLDNVIIFVARNVPNSSEDNYAANPNTIEVGYVKSPGFEIVDQETQKLSFSTSQKDWIVDMASPQTGKMKGDGFCTLGEWSTSEATAYMTGICANVRAQNPNWKKDEVISMLKRDTYKSSEYQYDANGWNERTGWGIVQPGKTMKENIFPSIPTKKNNEGKYYFKVSNFPAEYTIQGEGVSKDEIGYFVDLNSMEPGKYNYTFVGKCVYDGEGTEGQWAGTYDFPITRELVVDPSTDTVDLLLQNGLSAINLFPNPVNNILNINLPYENVSIKIFNIAGQLCLESELYSQNNQIDLSSLKSGVYLVNITDDKGNKRTEKIVKN